LRGSNFIFVVGRHCPKFCLKTMADPKDKGTRIRNRFFTTPNPLRPLSLTMKPLELDSPVVRAIEILKKIQVDKVVKSPEDIDFVIHVLGTGHDLYSPNFSKVLEDSEQKDNGNSVDQDLKSFLLYHSMRDWHLHTSKKSTPLTTTSPPSLPQKHRQKRADEHMISKITPFLELWDFDVFEIEKLTFGRSLHYTAMALFRKYKLIETFHIDEDKLSLFLTKVEEGYKVAQCPYHNNMHAADVTNSFGYLLSKCRLIEFVGAKGVFAGLVAAIIHDFRHPGYTNQFMINSDHELALTYNDQSVLENFHLAEAFKLIKIPDCNIFSGVSRETYRELREMIIQTVLATDMSRHFKVIGEFKSKLAAGGISSMNKDDVLLVLMMAMKVADLGHTSKKTSLHFEWCQRINEEFYRQGEEEARLNIPLSPFMNRKTTNVPKTQYGFLTYMVYPLYEVFSTQFPEATEFLDSIRANLEYWHLQLSQ
jgi:hypothetical protein